MHKNDTLYCVADTTTTLFPPITPTRRQRSLNARAPLSGCLHDTATAFVVIIITSDFATAAVTGRGGRNASIHLTVFRSVQYSTVLCAGRAKTDKFKTAAAAAGCYFLRETRIPTSSFRSDNSNNNSRNRPVFEWPRKKENKEKKIRNNNCVVCTHVFKSLPTRVHARWG